MVVTTRFDPKEFLAQVGEGKKITAFQPGDVIMKQGTMAEQVFYLQTGKAKETVRSEQGKDAVVGVIYPGGFFGTSSLDGGMRVSTVTAVSVCVVTTITKEGMRLALRREPKFAQLFMAYLLHHNSKIEAEKVDLLFNSSEKRLAQRLLMLAHVDDGPPQVIGPEITQEMLAAMIGTTRPRVSHFLNKFRKLGFVQYASEAHQRGHNGITVLPTLLRAVLLESPGTGIKQVEEAS